MNIGHEASWRMFCAIELPETARKLVLDRIARLREAAPGRKASWSRDGNLHLTLKFLGEVPQTSVANISAAAARAVVGLAPFAIRLEDVGAFPARGQPRVLWIGVNDFSGRLDELHRRLESEAAGAGFEKDVRPFHPHLTVARLRQPQDARALAVAHKEWEFEPAEVAVNELLVIRSELSSQGSKYATISRHELSSESKL